MGSRVFGLVYDLTPLMKYFAVNFLSVDPEKMVFFEKNVRLQDSGSRQIRSFPIDLTPLSKNFFRKNFLVNFFRRRPKNF